MGDPRDEALSLVPRHTKCMAEELLDGPVMLCPAVALNA